MSTWFVILHGIILHPTRRSWAEHKHATCWCEHFPYYYNSLQVPATLHGLAVQTVSMHERGITDFVRKLMPEAWALRVDMRSSRSCVLIDHFRFRSALRFPPVRGFYKWTEHLEGCHKVCFELAGKLDLVTSCEKLHRF